jgi:hypothetical protein
MAEQEDRTTYFIFRYGRKRIVSREDWEQSWLDWWYKVHNIKELN